MYVVYLKMLKHGFCHTQPSCRDNLLILKKRDYYKFKKVYYQMTKRQELLQSSKNAEITRVVFTEKVKRESAGQYLL